MGVVENAAVLDFVRQYCIQAASPHYAVLIEGDWGSGKTWLIKSFSKQLLAEHRKQSLYVSLYGVKSAADIAEQFYRQLHPILGSEAVQFTWALARKALKGTFKIGDDGAEVELSAPEFQNRLQTGGAVLIFDDLERSSMPIDEVLGLINQLVEHDDHRVLLLANAAKVPASGAGTPFATLKEKVVGRTFRVTANPGAAVEAFVEELSAFTASEHLARHQDLLIRVFERAGYQNLRQLRQAMLDFCYVWQALAESGSTAVLPDDFITRLLHEVLALSIEYRAGQITATDLDALVQAGATLPDVPGLARRSGQGAARLYHHGLNDSLAFALPPALYRDFFTHGEIGKRAARNALDNGLYFVGPQHPAWVRLWHWRVLSNQDFASLLSTVEKNYVDGHYQVPGEFLHATGLLLLFVRMGVAAPPGGVVQLGTGLIVKQWTGPASLGATLSIEDLDALESDSAGGLSYWSREQPEFQKIRTQLRMAVTAARQAAFEQWFEIWMTELRQDPVRWASRIVSQQAQRPMFLDQPIPHHLHLSEFADLIAAGELPMLHIVYHALRTRYAVQDLQPFAAESPFWQNMIGKLNFRLNKPGDTTLSRMYLQSHILPLMEHIYSVLDALPKQR